MTARRIRCVSSHRSRGRWLLAAAVLALSGCSAHDALFGMLGDYYDAGTAGPMGRLEKRQHYQQQVESWDSAR